MTVAVIMIVAIAALALLLREVRRDGYGTRPGPRSHAPWSAGDLPSEPYRSRP